MVHDGFATYCRIRPTRIRKQKDEIACEVINENKVSFVKYADREDLPLSVLKEQFEFQFSKVFDVDSSQEDVFDTVCKDVVLRTIQGYNGTIFAYGQTGSGKTFTIAGGDRYKDRGIVPRSISTLFEAFDQKSKQYYFNCYISYLEIYNECVYDLLDRRHAEKSIEDWTKIKLMDTSTGELHFQNLGVYEAHTEEEALKLLFLGNVNRATSETSMNQASSRSHAIFSINIEGKSNGSEEFVSSKLHLVDLAGSERVYRSTNSEQTKCEGKHINLSLHYLEQVVRALQTKWTKPKRSSAVHVPYRNSMLTSVLKGSLGGNCKSVFVATLNPEKKFLAESVSTCRFIQRCAMIQVEVKANTDIDIVVQVERLTKENKRLKESIEKMKMAYDKEMKAICSDNRAAIDELRSKQNLPMEQPTVQEELCLDYVEELGQLTSEDVQQKSKILTEIQSLGCPSAMYCVELLFLYVQDANHVIAKHMDIIDEQSRKLDCNAATIAKQTAKVEALEQELSILTQLNESRRSSISSNDDPLVDECNSENTQDLKANGHSDGDNDTLAGQLDSATVSNLNLTECNSNKGNDSLIINEAIDLVSITTDSIQGNESTLLSNTSLDNHEKESTKTISLSSPNSDVHASRQPDYPQEADMGQSLTNLDMAENTEIENSKHMDPMFESSFEVHESQSVDTVFRRQLEMLKAGEIFLKHGRRGIPHAKFVWVSDDLQWLNYRSMGSKKSEKRISTMFLREVLVGEKTKVFKRSSKHGLQNPKFSIQHSGSRTLDLEIAATVYQTTNTEKRDEWVSALQFLIKYKKVQHDPIMQAS